MLVFWVGQMIYCETFVFGFNYVVGFCGGLICLIYYGVIWCM